MITKFSSLRAIIILLLFGYVGSQEIQAQTIEDGIRSSFYDYYSTARSVGVAGAFSSLGADVSVISTNPAGIAEFRKSELSLTLQYLNNTNDAILSNAATSATENQISLGNITGVFHNDPYNANVQTMNIAIGINQLASFKERFSYAGRSPGSIVERFLEVANNRTLDELGAFDAGLAYDTEAILDENGDLIYESDFGFGNITQEVDRSENIIRSGTLHEFTVALGSNINNKFSWGVSLGFPFGRFEEQRDYAEGDPNDNVDFFTDLEYRQTLSTTSAGVNLKVGGILKLTPQLRIGASVHTPTFMMMKEDYNTALSYSLIFDGQPITYTEESPQFDPLEYNFTSPLRVLAGASYLYKASDQLRGFFSGEIEYVTYGSSNYKITTDINGPAFQVVEDALNRQIDEEWSSALNIRLGTELAYGAYRVRLGALLPSSSIQAIDPNLSLSGGIGYRADRYYVDAAFQMRSSNQTYTPYLLANRDLEQNVSIDQNRTVLSLTVGFKL